MRVSRIVCVSLLAVVPLVSGAVDALFAQPQIEWQRAIGGKGNDGAKGMCMTSDGGFLIYGSTSSLDGDVTQRSVRGTDQSDAWVVRLNRDRAIVWSKCIGGYGTDNAIGAVPTATGGCIVAVQSDSSSVDLPEGAPGVRLWVLRYSSTGDLEYRVCLNEGEHAPGMDVISQMISTEDGGALLVGETSAASVARYHDNGDGWIVRLNPSGTVAWSRSYGGSAPDVFEGVRAVPSGYIVVGRSTSTDGDLSGIPLAEGTAWILGIDSGGVLRWQTRLGHNSSASIKDIVKIPEGGYLAVGESPTLTAIVPFPVLQNGWVVKLSTTLEVEWEKLVGGSRNDGLQSVALVPGGYLLAGMTNSTDQDAKTTHGDYDGILFQLNESGDIVWRACLGGTGADNIRQIYRSGADTYLLGNEASPEIGGGHGASDIWLQKLASMADVLGCLPSTELSIELVGNRITVHTKGTTRVELVDMLGVVHSTSTVADPYSDVVFPVNNLTTGRYFVRAFTKHGIESRGISIQK